MARETLESRLRSLGDREQCARELTVDGIRLCMLLQRWKDGENVSGAAIDIEAEAAAIQVYHDKFLQVLVAERKKVEKALKRKKKRKDK